MKVAFVAPLVTSIREPQLGGSQALLADIASGLVARGHRVTVFAASGSQIEGVDVVDTGIDPSLLEATFFRANEEAGDFDIVRDAFAHVYGLIRALSFDVVHNHAFDVPAIDLSPPDVPVVHTLHLPPSDAIARAIERSRGENARTIAACVSEHSAAGWRAITDVDVVLRNGVPVERIPWSPSGGNRLLFAGRFSPEKGAAEAIEIAIAAGAELMLVGSPYDEGYAKERIDPFRGDARVDFIGAQPRAKLWELMSTSRAVLCPVQWDEPFGLVAAEAQAAGTPVVAFDRGALSEVVEDGRTGRLVDDIAQAVDAVITIATIDRAACRKHAEEHLSLERTLDEHEALYSSLAAAPMGTV